MNQVGSESVVGGPRAVSDYFQLLTANFNEPIFCIDERGDIACHNSAVARLFGYEENALTGSSAGRIIAPANQDAYQQILKQLTGGIPAGRRRLATVGMKRDGAQFPVELLFSSGLVDGSVCITCIVRDGGVAPETAASARNDQAYHKLIECLPGAVALMSLEMDIIFCNGPAVEILGCVETAQVHRKKFLGFVAEEDKARAQSGIRAAAAGDMARQRFSLTRDGGAGIQVDLSASPVFDGEGRPKGFLVLFNPAPDLEASGSPESEELKTAIMGTASAISSVVKLKDPHVADHQQRVTKLACAIAKEMGLPESQLECLHVAGNLHDIGKMMVPPQILSKKGKLTPEEFALVKNHVRISHEVIEPIEFPWPVAEVVFQHHERIDGTGYPNGIKGEAMTIEARILAVADVIEAMSSHRPYRAGLGINKALEEVTVDSAGRFDQEVAETCAKLFRERRFYFI